VRKIRADWARLSRKGLVAEPAKTYFLIASIRFVSESAAGILL
jgi:hypothetical protein